MAKIVSFSHIPSEKNYADILTKPLPSPTHSSLVKDLLFRRADVIEKAVEPSRQVKMATRIPTNEEQDEEESRGNCLQFQRMFNQRRETAISRRRYTEYREFMLGDILAIRKC